MKITIDTEKDSAEDIKKAISFLGKLIDEDSTPGQENKSNSPPIGMFGMFDDDRESESNISCRDEAGTNSKKESDEQEEECSGSPAKIEIYDI